MVYTLKYSDFCNKIQMVSFKRGRNFFLVKRSSMEEEKKYRKIMPDIIRAINETDDIENVEYYENIMVPIFGSYTGIFTRKTARDGTTRRADRCGIRHF